MAWRRGLGGIEDLAAALSGAATQADVTEIILRHSREVVGAMSVAAALRTRDGSDLAMVGMAGFDAETERAWSRLDLGVRTPMGDAVLTGAPVFLEAPDDRARAYPHLPAMTGGEAIAAIPVRGSARRHRERSRFASARRAGSSAAIGR